MTADHVKHLISDFSVWSRSLGVDGNKRCYVLNSKVSVRNTKCSFMVWVLNKWHIISRVNENGRYLSPTDVPVSKYKMVFVVYRFEVDGILLLPNLMGIGDISTSSSSTILNAYSWFPIWSKCHITFKIVRNKRCVNSRFQKKIEIACEAYNKQLIPLLLNKKSFLKHLSVILEMPLVYLLLKVSKLFLNVVWFLIS